MRPSFLFDVEMMSAPVTDDSWTSKDCPTKEDFFEAFDREYFSYGGSDLHTDPHAFTAGGGPFTDLEVDDDGSIETESGGYLMVSIDKTEDGIWIATFRHRIEMQLSMFADDEEEAASKISSLAKELFYLRETPVVEVKLTLA